MTNMIKEAADRYSKADYHKYKLIIDLLKNAAAVAALLGSPETLPPPNVKLPPDFEESYHQFDPIREIRKGGYLNLEDINDALERLEKPEYRDFLVYARQNVRILGPESLAHLCLPARLRNGLDRQTVSTIVQARNLLKSLDGGLLLRNFGPVFQEYLRRSINEFDQLKKP